MATGHEDPGTGIWVFGEDDPAEDSMGNRSFSALLNKGQLSVITAVLGLVGYGAPALNKQAAKNPDLLIVGAVVRNGSDVITSAGVVWPDGTAGTFTTDAIDASGAINGYHITYGVPATKTYTQPTITRSTSGAAITVPQIVVT